MKGKAIILAAVIVEARAIASALSMRPAQGMFAAATVGPLEVELHLVGIRAGRLPEVRWGEYSLIIMAGFAGGLDPSLRTGDIVIDGTIDVPGLACRRARIHTADRTVCSPEGKAAVFASTGAGTLDMENAAVRRVARSAGVPFLGVRVILDPADQALPEEVAVIAGPTGKVRLLPLLARLLRRPSLIRDLVRLSRSARMAGAKLGRAVREIVASLSS